MKLTRKQRAAFYQDAYRAFENVREGFRQWGWIADKRGPVVALGELYIGRSRQ